MKLLFAPFRKLDDWFFRDVDARSYTAVRVAFATVALAIWCDLWPLRYTFFADIGMFGAVSGPPTQLNVFALGNSTLLVNVVFLSSLVAIVCLFLGILVRVTSILVYVWVVSYSTQTSAVLAGYDTVFRTTAFAVILSPAPAAWSLRPQWLTKTKQALPRYGLRLLQWQLLLIYWCTVWLKAPDQYWRRGEVISYMLLSNFSRFPTPHAASLGLLNPLFTWGTLLIEALVPILLWQRHTRSLGVFLGFALHAGIAATTKLALFSLAMVPLYLAFFEQQDWDRCQAWLRRFWPEKQPS
jgi:hypothetical protein